MRLRIYFLWFIIIPLALYGQNPETEGAGYQEILESIIPVQNDETSESIEDNLNQWISNPVNINTAGPEDLRALFLLSPSQIDSLLSYRSKQGQFISLEELYYIDGFDPYLVRLLTPFLTLGNGKSMAKRGIKYWIAESRKSMIARYSRQVELPVGYHRVPGKPSVYLGNPDRYLLRFRLSDPENFSAGFSLEKDKGEPLLWSPVRNYYGFDYESFHVAIFNCGHLKNLILGDFKMQSGEGLVLGNGFYLGKSTETIASVRNRGAGIKPYTGSGESGFFRGTALEFRFGNIDVSSFISFKKIDARTEMDIDHGQQEIVIRSLGTSGLHRTINEIEGRKNEQEFSTGFHLNYRNKKRNFSIGSTSSYTRFSADYREVPVYYNQFDFKGQDFAITGIDYNYFHRKFSVFGELAVTAHQGLGFVQGLIGNLSRNIETALHIRYYNPSFHSFYGNPFREASSPGNESGIYWGIRILPVKKIILNFYIDIFRFPWLKYNLRSPSSGNDFFARIIVNASRNIEIYGQYLRKSKEAAIHGTGIGIDDLGENIKNQYWVQASMNMGTHFISRSRIQYTTTREAENITRGIAAFQDFGFRGTWGSVHGRLLWFNALDYENRQYIFEQSALFDYQVPSFYGMGLRFYTLVNIKTGRYFHWWLKTGRTIFQDVQENGTGPEKILVPHKTEVLIQVEFKF